MAYVLDPLCISTRGEVTPTGLQPFALTTSGEICMPRAGGGGDPEGAWERVRRRYENRRRHVPHETQFEQVEELTALAADLDAEISNAQQLLELDLEDVDTLILEQRERVIFLEAFRAQRNIDELRQMIELAQEHRRLLNNDIALHLAIAAIFVK